MEFCWERAKHYLDTRSQLRPCRRVFQLLAFVGVAGLARPAQHVDTWIFSRRSRSGLLRLSNGCLSTDYVVLQMAQKKQKRTAAAAVENPKLNHKLVAADIGLRAGGNPTSQATKAKATRTAALAKQTTEEPALADVGLRATAKPKRRPTRTNVVANQTKPNQKPAIANVGPGAAADNEATHNHQAKEKACSHNRRCQTD